MRKYIIGILIGAALTFAAQAGASTLLGSSVDAVINVEVDGENLGQAPVIDGVSYLPVRKFGNEVGYKVEFGEGKATLTSDATELEVIVDPEPTPTPTTEPTPIVPDHGFTLDNIDQAIKDYEGRIRTSQIAVNSVKGINAAEDARLEEGMQKMYKELERLKEIKAELEAQ